MRPLPSGLFLLLSLLLLSLLAPTLVRAQAPLAFQRLTAEDGLVQNNVKALLQDRTGFVWIGTQEGLSRYDGVRFTAFRHASTDTTTLLHDYVYAVREDRAGFIWVVTNGGLSRFDPRTERFRRYPYHAAQERNTVVMLDLYEDRAGRLWALTWDHGLLRLDPSTGRYTQVLPPAMGLPGAYGEGEHALFAMHEDAAGMLWLGTRFGLVRFDPRTGALRRYGLDPRDPASLASPAVRCVASDGSGGLWLGTETGLVHFEPATGRVQPYRSHPARPANAVTDAVRALLVDADGTVWLGTNEGLDRFDPATGAFTQVRHDPEDPASLGAGRVSALLEDRTGVLWAGTERGGTSRFDRYARRITRVERLPDGRTAGLVKAFLEDRAGRLWFGSETGLVRQDPATGAVVRFTEAANGLPGASINVLYEDPQGTVWAGTEGAGLGRLAPGATRFEMIQTDVRGENFVYALLQDHTGTLWVGTNGGLRRRDAAGRWRTLLPDPSRAGLPWVTALAEDATGTLWVGTDVGLERLDRARGTFTHFRHIPTDTTTLPGGTILSLRVGRGGALWVVTEGLNRLDTRTGQVTRFTAANSPLLSRLLYGVLEDGAGRLWINGSTGLVRFDPATRAWRRYDTGPVSMPLDQALGAYLRTRDGRLFFGRQDGYLVFEPAALRDNPHPPPVALTGLQVGEQRAPPGPGGPLPVALPFARAVRLAYDDRFITFEFAALHFSDPARNTYSYKLEGFDAQWHAASHEAKATYTNLPPGRYTFRVRAASADGVWNEAGASVAVLVTPPWWGTWWFRLFAVLAVVAAVVAAVRLRLRALSARNRQLEVQVARRTSEIEQQRTQLAAQATRLLELDETKSRFFANLSHEFRTPLTLIQGYLEDVAEAPTAPVRRTQGRVGSALDQTQRLASLVESLLDLTRLQEHRLRLQLEPGDLSAFVTRVAGAFSSLAARRQVTLAVETAPEPLPLLFDAERMEQVLTNLIGNALKFTPPGGQVQVRAFRAPAAEGAAPQAVFQVTDTGPGIAAEVLPRLFERFYQADSSSTRSFSGLGIGLALVQELVELHGGHVSAESQPGQGSTFTVRFPLAACSSGPRRRSAFAGAAQEDRRRRGWNGGAPSAGAQGDGAALVAPTPTQVGGRVLVVEDHAELRAYLAEHLAPPYRVTTAVNGRDAWAQMEQEPPDLIVSDIMMPVMDGLELLARVKQDARFRTIPVLLLTARSDPDDRLAGLEAAADGYLAKPFRVAELRAQVRNLLGLREAIARQSGRQVVAVQPAEMPLEDADAAFIRRVQGVLTTHLQDEGFSLPALAAELFVSERTLRRRIVELTGFSASAYVRHVRLLHAKALLDRHAYRTLSEVAHAVGFKNVSHFTRRFTEAFGAPPPEPTADAPVEADA